MKKVITLLIPALQLLSCSTYDECGMVVEKIETINSSSVYLTIRFDNGSVRRILSSNTSIKVGDYECF